jgi:hypothetical protein
MFYPMLSGRPDYSASIQNNADAAAARADAREAKTETELMRADIERLLMITEALWTFLKKEHGYSDEELAEAITQIDLRDGVLDGKVAKTLPPPCPNCGRINGKGRPVCMYCGKPIPISPFAR